MIRVGLGKKDEQETMLHEMVHARVGRFHGRKFVAELKRLRRIGAPLSPYEFDLKEGDKLKVSRDYVRSRVEDCVDDNMKRTQIYEALEDKFRMPISYLKRRINVDRIIRDVQVKNVSERLRQVDYVPLVPVATLSHVLFPIPHNPDADQEKRRI